jgi:hypothetical protein
MIDAKCIRDIDLVKNPDDKRRILESNNWSLIIIIFQQIIFLCRNQEL